ncbi:MAG: AgmX/PglI C-terminal domain-containing protein [Proteobacteria bacterium]|nr:AgmX/PglI C-terminal domain-containing protein [Pseudomonadota bacterium]
MKLRFFILAVVIMFTLSCGLLQPRNTGKVRLVDDVESTVNPCEIPNNITGPRLILAKWPVSEKAVLQAGMGNSVIVVKYDGCRVERLDHCRVTNDSDFSNKYEDSLDAGVESKFDDLRVKEDIDRDSISDERLTLLYMAVSTLPPGKDSIDQSMLGSDCNEATHFIRTLTMKSLKQLPDENEDTSTGSNQDDESDGVLSASSSKNIIHLVLESISDESLTGRLAVNEGSQKTDADSAFEDSLLKYQEVEIQTALKEAWVAAQKSTSKMRQAVERFEAIFQRKDNQGSHKDTNENKHHFSDTELREEIRQTYKAIKVASDNMTDKIAKLEHVVSLAKDQKQSLEDQRATKLAANNGIELTSQEVAKVLHRHLGTIKSCYESALRRNPFLEGKVIVRLAIDIAGEISDTEITLNELTPDIGNCISNTISKVSFPPPPISESGVTVFEYPFFFSSAKIN